MFKMDVASLNTSLIVVLILLILFLIGVYFSVNYNQTQTAKKDTAAKKGKQTHKTKPEAILPRVGCAPARTSHVTCPSWTRPQAASQPRGRTC